MDNINDFTKEQLIAQIKSLQAHNIQLKNIIAKGNKRSEGKRKFEEKLKKFNFQKCKYRHILLKCFYLGWDYHGFVIQEDTMNTIEHQIFEALSKTCLIESRSNSRYHRCGRTDKGVSSFSQVISIDVRSKSDDTENEFNFCKILNSVLPANIQFVAWCPVEKDFSARFDYIEAMKAGAQYLEGTHDFRNFCKMDVNNGVVEFVRTVLSVDISYFDKADENYSIYVLTIKGNAFLWHQIRCIVGILILIGQGREKSEIIVELLDVTTNPRKPEYHMASEIPLNLYDCHYDDVNWIYDKEALNIAMRKLHYFWTFSAVKATMVKSMLLDIEEQSDTRFNQTNDILIPGAKPKMYTPLFKRQLCGSLEDKMERSKEKRRRKEAI